MSALPARAAITAAAAHLPGSPTLAAWSERVLAARPAPLVELGPRWGVPPERYRAARPGEPGKTYLEQAFGCELEVPPGADRQHALAQDVVRQLLAERRAKGPLPARVGLIVATEWAGEAYFQADVRQTLAELLPPEALAAGPPPLGPDALLERLAREAELTGPRLAIDTACASSLYALDVGAGWLAKGEADAVLVLGLTGFLPLFLFVGFSKLRALSPSARLLPFARDAQGIVPGEGAGAVLLEAADSPHAEARIVGLGLSCDGADRSVFAPAAEGQRRAYQAAYRHVDPATIDVVEAHGTATPLGDEVEVATLDAFFAPHRAGRPLPLGSAKALVGHTLAAAGMASLLKVLAMLRAETLAPHIPVEPHPRLAGTCCELLRAPRPWPRGERPRRAGISAFGFGGSNAHLVVEEALDAPPPEAPAPGLDQLVLSDVELALGSALDSAALQRALREQRPLFSTFGAGRFGRDRVAWGAPQSAALGAYLPGRFEVEGEGLRLGPNLLARLDPLQQLTTELARRLLARQSVEEAATGVALVSNLGGDTALRLYRRADYETRAAAPEAHQAAALGPDTTTEAIATSLTPMASGYPAFHLDLRSFHLTLSGEPGSLLDALALAPHWLARHADALLLGAARTIKGPQDLSEDAGPPGEGAGLLLLESAARARARGAEPLAELVALGRGSPDQLRAEAGLEERITAVERVALGPCDEPEGAQVLTGFLHEAAGLEGLAALLARDLLGLKALVLGERTLLFRQLRAWEPAPPPPLARAQEVAFSPALAAPQAAPDLGLLGASLRHGAAAVRSFLALQREALALIDPDSARAGLGATPPGAALPRAAEREPGPRALASAAELRERAAALRERPQDRVLSELRAGEGELHARVVVDETHPYFFDHPLDHVPGILLVEAALQLAEAGAPELLPLAPGEVYGLSELSLRFRRWCEKEAPIELVLVPQGDPASGLRILGRFEQSGAVVATLELELGRFPLPAGDAGLSPPAQAEDAPPPLELVHKRRAENVLVRSLVDEGQRLRARLVPPPPGHLFASGHPQLLPGLYLLESARQAVMLGAHGVEGVPLGRPMNLISFELSLARPIRREEALSWRLRQQPYVALGETLLGDVACELVSGAARVGRARVKAQVVTSAVYRRQRGRS